jgi:hypothetical protein
MVRREQNARAHAPGPGDRGPFGSRSSPHPRGERARVGRPAPPQRPRGWPQSHAGRLRGRAAHEPLWLSYRFVGGARPRQPLAGAALRCSGARPWAPRRPQASSELAPGEAERCVAAASGRPRQRRSQPQAAASALALWKPKARRVMRRILLLSPSTRPLLKPVET